MAPFACANRIRARNALGVPTTIEAAVTADANKICAARWESLSAATLTTVAIAIFVTTATTTVVITTRRVVNTVGVVAISIAQIGPRVVAVIITTITITITITITSTITIRALWTSRENDKQRKINARPVATTQEQLGLQCRKIRERRIIMRTLLLTHELSISSCTGEAAVKPIGNRSYKRRIRARDETKSSCSGRRFTCHYPLPSRPHSSWLHSCANMVLLF